MALSAYARQGLDVGLANKGDSDEIADIIDADTGTVGAGATVRVLNAFGKVDAAHFLAVVNSGAGGAPAGFTEQRIRQLCGFARGQEIIDEIAGNE